MKLDKVLEALHISDKYQIEPLEGDSVHADSIVNLKRRDQENPRNFFLKGYTELTNKAEIGYADDEMIDDELYPYGKLAGVFEYAAYKIYKYIGVKVPKAFHIHFNHIADRHELLVSAFKHPKTFGDYFNDKKKNDIEDRKLKFASTLEPFLQTYGKVFLNDFYKYWTEPNKSNTKFRAELEKTWDVERRLETWARNDKNFKPPTKFGSSNQLPNAVI